MFDDGVLRRSKKGKASSSDAQIPFELWLSEREETITWLEFISLILASAKAAVRLLEKGTSIIFHCRYRTPLPFSFVYNPYPNICSPVTAGIVQRRSPHSQNCRLIPTTGRSKVLRS